MKSLITLLVTLFASISFAGGSGGGGVLLGNAMMKVGFGRMATVNSTNGGGVLNPKEIIFNMGQKDGLVKFAYGQLVDKKWQVQKLEILETELMADAPVMKALQDSKDLKSWAEIK